MAAEIKDLRYVYYCRVYFYVLLLTVYMRKEINIKNKRETEITSASRFH